MGIVVSTIIDQDSVEADNTKVSSGALLREASREGEGICEGAVDV